MTRKVFLVQTLAADIFDSITFSEAVIFSWFLMSAAKLLEPSLRSWWVCFYTKDGSLPGPWLKDSLLSLPQQCKAFFFLTRRAYANAPSWDCSAFTMPAAVMGYFWFPALLSFLSMEPLEKSLWVSVNTVLCLMPPVILNFYAASNSSFLLNSFWVDFFLTCNARFCSTHTKIDYTEKD